MWKECLIRSADGMSFFYLFRANISNRSDFQYLKQKHQSEKRRRTHFKIQYVPSSNYKTLEIR